MRSADRIAGAALLALAVAFSLGALKHYAYWGENGPGPGFLPFWLGLVMALLAAMLFVGALRSRDPGAAWLPRGESLGRLALVIGATIAFVALLGVVGMTVGTVLFIFVLVRFLDRQPWTVSIAVALAVAALNYVVFTRWLRVPMPVGLFGF
ncbi:MAG: tripartite tricarboxylate transporter TctB family protein [Caldimonas sp.]